MDRGGDADGYKQVGDLVRGSGASRDSPLLGDAPEPMDANSRRQRLRAVRFARSLSVRSAMRHVQMIDSAGLNRAYALVLLSRVYIGGLNMEVNRDELSQLLSTCGPVTYLHLPRANKPGKMNKGFAFAQFLMPEAALLAIETLWRSKLHGIPIHIGRPANVANIEQLLESLSGECPDRDRWVYVANVPGRATEADLRAALSGFGRISELRLQPDPGRPGQHRGFGFTRFASAATAEAAIEKRFVVAKAKEGIGSRRLPLLLGRIVSPPGVATGCLPSGMPPPTAACAAAAAAAAVDVDMDLSRDSEISSSGNNDDDESVQLALFSSGLEEALGDAGNIV